ncbi:tripartite motif-containing protein 2-like [Dysidea avara]|uniref:tripartite motif-containing protein 2-like n=1 Tax=Dysidea avara TaxID=196820 RepID=UPI003316E521
MADDAGRETLTRTSSLEQSEELQQIEEEITCSICGNLFNDPKTIPCLHTFCKCCLEGSIESNKKMAVDVSCPLCRAPLPRDEIASIPTNFTIKRLIEILQKKKKDKMASECDNCHIRWRNSLTTKPIKAGTEVDTDVASASFWCVQCEKCLCEKCLDAHSQWGEFAEHKCIAIEEFVRNPKPVLSSAALQLKELELCKHHSKALDFYCKTCRCLICHYCTAKDHKVHEYEDKLTEVADEEREEVKHITAPLEEMLERVRRAVKELENTEKQIEVEGEANIEKIRATYDEVHKLLKQQEEEAIDKANAIKESFKKRNAAQKDEVKFLQNDLATCDEFRTKILEMDRTRLLLTYSDWVKKRVVRLKREVDSTSFDPEFKAVDIVVRCPEPVEFINNLGSEMFDVPCLQNCIFSQYAHIVKSAVRSSSFGNLLSLQPAKVDTTDQIKVTVILRDRFGFPVTDQSNDLEIYCNDKDEDFLQDPVITERSNGEYHIWYNPKARENHSLQVYWKEHLVNYEEIKALMTVRNYTHFGQPAKIIDKYGPSNMTVQLSEPNLLVKGPNNEVIVYDHSTKQLVVFDKQFQYSHVIGETGDGNGKFRCVTGIAVDRNGYLYAVDCVLHCIQKFKLSGEFISQLGGEGTSGDNMKSPFSLVVSQSDELFVCDSDKHSIKVFQYDSFAYSFGQHGTEPGSFNCPQDLALNNSEDQLFISDHCNDRVQVFTPKGKFLRIFDTFPGVVFRLKSPFRIHYTPDGHLLVICKDTNCVVVLKEDGTFVHAIESRRGRRFSDLCGVVVMDDGQTVITDKSNSRLVVLQ